jgi:hypothetical protein
MDWDDYEIFDPGPEVNRPHAELPRRDARRAFNRLMAEKERRKAELRKLVAANGIELDGSDGSIDRLEAWFRASVEGSSDEADRLKPIWYAVVNDIGLFLGDEVIRRAPNVGWVLNTFGRTNLSYHRAVLAGFNTPAKNFTVDPELVVGNEGHEAITGERLPSGRFVGLVNSAVRHAT